MTPIALCNSCHCTIKLQSPPIFPTLDARQVRSDRSSVLKLISKLDSDVKLCDQELERLLTLIIQLRDQRDRLQSKATRYRNMLSPVSLLPADLLREIFNLIGFSKRNVQRTIGVALAIHLMPKRSFFLIYRSFCHKYVLLGDLLSCPPGNCGRSLICGRIPNKKIKFMTATSTRLNTRTVSILFWSMVSSCRDPWGWISTLRA
jgi:hypothetical protein